MLDYLVLAMIPGLFWLWFFWRKDTFEKEPARYLAATFLLGVVMVIPALFLEAFLVTTQGIIDMMMVGIIEEICKFMAVYVYVYRKSEFNEVMDGIIYAAAASLGFASLENLLYIFSHGALVMVGRALLSTLGHVLFASFWGYALGLKKMTGRNAVPAGLILSIVAHGIYDIIVIAPYWYVNLLVIPLMVVLYKSMSSRVKRSLIVSPFRSSEGTTCPRCGTKVPAGSAFCPNCGGAL